MSGCDRRCAGVRVDHLGMVAAGMEGVSLLLVQFYGPFAIELWGQLQWVLHLEVGVCIASDLAGLSVRIGRLSAQFYLFMISLLHAVVDLGFPYKEGISAVVLTSSEGK